MLAPAPALSLVALTPVHVIPFELRGGHVLLSAEVNGRPATFILDTGSSACTMAAETWSAVLPAMGSTATAMGGSGSVAITMTKVQSLRIGSVVLHDETVALIPMRQVSEQHGREIAGTIGYTLFARYVVEIDYAAHVLRLYEPESYRYDGTGGVMPIDLAKRIPIARVMVKPQGGPALEARLVLDIGTATLGAALSAPFIDAHAADFAAARQVTETTIGVGKDGAGSATRVEWIDAGGVRAEQPVVMLMRDHAGFFGVTWADGTLGASIFERTTTIIDYPRQRVILEPAKRWAEPFLYDASGLSLSASGAALDSVVVRTVLAGSAAELAGIHVGDVVTSVDQVRANRDSLEEMRSLLRVNGAVRHIVVRRQGVEMTFVVALQARI